MITHDRWQRIKEIFQSAQEKTRTERVEFLDEVCGDDKSIREEVEALLTADDSNEDFLSAPAYQFAAGMLSDEEPEASEFANGQRVGRYTILCPLGAGGMGQIYLAQDEELGRKIALKMIARAFAADPRRVQRFQQEARAASALNHPNVCVIHETGVTENNRHFIAMEYIQGITLRDKLTREKITPLEALHIARQVADALSAAHAAGIVHRDIKPENIMLRPDGYVKVLDFGLAKLTEVLQEPEPRIGISQLANTSVRTETGTLMGTVKYMSPEQLGEIELDERTDIWSLGVVIYEMLTRTTPFEARTPNGTIALINGPQLPALELPDQLPALFPVIVQKAVNKNRDDRYQTVTKLAADLSALQRELEREAESGLTPSVPARLGWYPQSIGDLKTRTLHTGSVFSRFKSQAIHTADLIFNEIRLPTLFAGMTAVLVFLLFLPDLIKTLMDPPAVKQVQIQMESFTNSGTSICSAISPDGKWVAHAEEQGGKQRLMVTSTETPGSLVVVPLEEVAYLGVTFSPDNYLYFARTEKNNDGILYRLPFPGGVPVKLKEGVDSPISVSPQGDRFAFVRLDNVTNEYFVVVSDIAGTEERTLATRKASNRFSQYGLTWSPDGRTVVCPAGRWDKGFHIDLIAIDVNTGNEQVIGNRSWSSVYQVAWQHDMTGLIISARDRVMAPHQLWRVTYPAGEVQRLTTDTNEYRGVSLSGKKIVTVKTDWNWKMWRSTVDGSSSPESIASGWGLMYGICWTARGKIVYSAMAQDRLSLWRIDPDGSNKFQLTVGSGDNYTPAVSADGKFIVFTSANAAGFDIYRLNIETGNDVKQLTHTDGNSYPTISSDNQWVAYDHIDEMGRSVWKVPLEGGEPVKVSDGYRMPAYSPDQKLIVARSPLNSGNDDVAIFSAAGGPPLKRIRLPIIEWQRVYWMNDHTVSFIKNVGGTSNIWSYDVNTDESKQLTNFNGDQIFTYAWSPDYKEIVFQRGTKLANVTIISSEQ